MRSDQYKKYKDQWWTILVHYSGVGPSDDVGSASPPIHVGPAGTILGNWLLAFSPGGPLAGATHVNFKLLNQSYPLDVTESAGWLVDLFPPYNQ